MPESSDVTKLGTFSFDRDLRFTWLDDGDATDLLGQSIWTIIGGPWRQALYRALKSIARGHASVDETVIVADRKVTAHLSRTDAGYEASFTITGMGGTVPTLIAPVAQETIHIATPPEGDDFFVRAADLLCVLTVPAGRLKRINPAWERALGFPVAALEGKRLEDLIHLDDQQEVAAALSMPTSDPSPRRFTCRLKSASGELRYLQWSAAVGQNGGELYAAARDVTEHRVAEAAIRRQIYRDPLTQLHNRRFLEDQLGEALAAGNDSPLALLFIDLDRFKPINDALGHDVGDQVLQVVARRLEQTLRAEDVVARLGGDEFVALLPRIAALGDAALVAQKLLEALQQPCHIAGQDLVLSASIGISIAPLHGREPLTLMKLADAAMYQAKRDGRGGYAVYQPEADDSGVDPLLRLQLESRLGQAVERNELRLHYQPQIDATTGAVMGFEALLRWQPDGMGIVPAGAFLPVAEEMGLLVSMGEWAIDEACRQASEWSGAMDGLQMSINLSARQLNDPQLADKVERALRESNLDPANVELELTETVLARGGDQMRETLGRLHDLGVRLCLDDFGTGYANFAYISNLKLDRLKIDRSLVMNICGNEKDEMVVRAIVGLAHTLGMKVVAEGVETQEQYDKLVLLGCDILQGFFFSRPLPPAEIPRMLPSKS